jgi:hypothetical protein
MSSFTAANSAFNPCTLVDKDCTFVFKSFTSVSIAVIFAISSAAFAAEDNLCQFASLV